MPYTAPNHPVKRGPNTADSRSLPPHGHQKTNYILGTKRLADDTKTEQKNESELKRPRPLPPQRQTNAAPTPPAAAAAAPVSSAPTPLSREEALQKLEERKKEIEALKLKLQQSEKEAVAATQMHREKEAKEAQDQHRIQADLAKRREQLARGLGSLASASTAGSRKDSSGAKLADGSNNASDDSGNAETRAEIDRVLSSRNDYYVLKVPVGSALSQVKVGYRRLAMMLHPDKCKLEGAAEAFQKINASHLNLCKVLQNQS